MWGVLLLVTGCHGGLPLFVGGNLLRGGRNDRHFTVAHSHDIVRARCEDTDGLHTLLEEFGVRSIEPLGLLVEGGHLLVEVLDVLEVVFGHRLSADNLVVVRLRRGAMRVHGFVVPPAAAEVILVVGLVWGRFHGRKRRLGQLDDVREFAAELVELHGFLLEFGQECLLVLVPLLTLLLDRAERRPSFDQRVKPAAMDTENGENEHDQHHQECFGPGNTGFHLLVVVSRHGNLLSPDISPEETSGMCCAAQSSCGEK